VSRPAPYFTPAERDDAGELLIAALGRQDAVGRIVRLGSAADGTADRHSDIDLAVVVTADAEVAAVATACTQVVLATLPVFHHFSQSLGQIDFHGFLLESFLEVDIGFAHEGVLEAETAVPRVDAAAKLDFIWHDVVHAAVALDRGRPRRALWYVARLRDGALELASGRLGSDVRHFKDVDDLPPETLALTDAAIPAGPAAAQIWPALRAATTAIFAEGRKTNPEVADKLEPRLMQFLDTIAPEQSAVAG
jgi:hypothetical protein